MKSKDDVSADTTTSAAPLIGRRTFLCTAALTGVSALVGEWWGRAHAPAIPAVVPFPIAAAAELPAGNALGFTIVGTTIPGVLVRLDAETCVAFDRRCPHLGCPVQWSRERTRFECPCHAAVFDGSSGRVLAGPPRRGLRPIELERRGTELWVRGIADEEDRERSGA
jgi:Rieske Fe-S protein